MSSRPTGRPKPERTRFRQCSAICRFHVWEPAPQALLMPAVARILTFLAAEPRYGVSIRVVRVVLEVAARRYFGGVEAQYPDYRGNDRVTVGVINRKPLRKCGSNPQVIERKCPFSNLAGLLWAG